MAEMKLKLTAGTHVGLVRKNNEDNFVVNPDLAQSRWIVPGAEEETTPGKYGSLMVVADGMGGTNAGEVASALAIETVQAAFVPEKLEEAIVSEESVEKFMKETIRTADLNIINEGKENSSTQGMGTTIVMLWLLAGKAYVAWCGDSRCYVFNEKSGCLQLTKDHSYVQELVDQGKLEAENAFDHPYSNIITRCLGDPDQRANPDFRSYVPANGDLFLLCSDGLCGLCRDEEIMQVLGRTQDDMGQCKEQLIAAALEAGGYDNVTVALCRVSCGEDNRDEEVSLNATRCSRVGCSCLMKGLLLLVVILLAVGFYAYWHPQCCREWKKGLSALSSDSASVAAGAVDSLSADTVYRESDL